MPYSDDTHFCRYCSEPTDDYDGPEGEYVCEVCEDDGEGEGE